MKSKIIVVLICSFCFLTASTLLAEGGGESSRIQQKYLSARDHFRKGDYEAAVKGFEEVVKIDPNYKVVAEYLKVSKARLLAKSKKEAVLQKRREMFKEAAKKKEKREFKSEKDVTDARRRQLAKEEEKKAEEGRIKEEKEAEKKKIQEERKRIREEEKRIRAEEKRIQEEKKREEKAKKIEEKKAKIAEKIEKKRIEEEAKRENAILKRKKQLAHYHGIDELEKISQDAQDMISDAAKKRALREEIEAEMWASLASLPSPKKERAIARMCMATASVAYKKGDYGEAIKEWEKASAMDPDNPVPQQRIEKIHQILEKNRQIELKKARRKSIVQIKATDKKYCRRGEYLYRHKNYKGSLEEFQKSLSVNPNSKVAKKGIFKAKKVIRAKELKAERVLQKRVQQISKLVSKGDRYLEEKKYSKAKAYALKALELDSDSGAANKLLENAEKGLLQK